MAKESSQSPAKKMVFWVVLFLMAGILSEAVLQVLSQISKKSERVHLDKKTLPPLLVEDEKLGVRGNPDYPGHDENGFHNRHAIKPGEADIITLGDSQTYGYGLASEDSWPSQLAKVKGCRVYNMAIESSGPVQSMLLFDETLELKPKLILAAIYLGNDLYDSYEAVYHRKLAPHLVSKEPGILKKLEKTEGQDPLKARISRQGALAYQDERYQEAPARKFFWERSRIFSLLTETQRVFVDQNEDWEAIQREVSKTREARQVFDNGKVRTVFTPQYRLIAVNMEDLRIREGLRITLDSAVVMASKSREAGIPFVTVLIPTKESVFQGMENQAVPVVSTIYTRQVESETAVRQKMEAELQRQQIPVLNLLPGMKGETQNGASLYSMTWDGHPSPAGCRAMAGILARHLPDETSNGVVRRQR